ncbi:signal peptidase I [Undibacterium flavidum]|uniref:Signal peptidase I n=1 Tax=Undibacterium flavidum TaxID=2762297 RepID=A0ABR6YAW9_9BURK|nr:signal peptidase I [Undibacterium flavidum]MBC3873798.1 signal peptidase I [Undibacterium flavidum]
MHNKPKPWIAVLIAFFATPLAMMYLGKLRYALLYFVLLLVIAFGLFFYLGSELAASLAKLLYLVVGITHAYKIAKHFPDEKIRPSYSRWYYLVSVFFVFVAMAFLIRAFTFEPFKAPSASMSPTIPPKSFLLVQKWGYGNYASFGVTLSRAAISSPLQRGDILVFEVPDEIKTNYVKRLIGLPDDRVEYRNKRLTINGLAIVTRKTEEDVGFNDVDNSAQIDIYEEQMESGSYHVMIDRELPPIVVSYPREFMYNERCQFDATGFVCTVPKDHYFMMGDNRDNSRDSRYWGFLPADHIVGKVVTILK